MAVWVNRGIEIKGLYMDDLYFWSCYGEQSFWEYVFPMGSTRFRFLYYLAAWLEMAVVQNHTGLFVPINILLNAALSWMLYSIGRRLAASKGVGFLCGAMFLISRMAYYQIGQVLGLMETMALWMAVLILWYLYRYLNEEGQQRRYFIACGLYFGVCFVHERYMALIPLFLLTLLLKRSRKLWEWLAPVISFLAVQLIRALTIGSVLPAGTGGTQVADTFSISRSIRFALSQAAYVFGINAGPEHLNGLPWSESPWLIRGLVILADLMVAALVVGLLIRLVKSGKDVRRSLLKNIANVGRNGSAIVTALLHAAVGHPGGNALGVRFPGRGPAVYGLDVRRADRGCEERAVFKTLVALGRGLCLLCAPHASGGTVLPGVLPQIVPLAQPAALQFPGRGNL